MKGEISKNDQKHIKNNIYNFLMYMLCTLHNDEGSYFILFII